MRLRILAFTLLCVGLNVVSDARPASADQPDPTFSISCTVGGETALSWKHVRVTEVRLAWYDAAGNLEVQSVQHPRGPRLTLLTPTTVDDGGRVEATLLFAGGGGAELAPTTCTT